MTTSQRVPWHEAVGATSNGQVTSKPVALDPPTRRVRLPELAVGLLVTVAFALGAVLWHLSSVTKVSALAVASSVERGDTIEAADLRVVYIASDDTVARLDEGQTSQVVGRTALVDLPSGTLLAPGLIAAASTIGEGEAVAGLALDPGQYPARGLAAGDRVSVVRAVEGGGTTEGARGEAVVASNATVFAVEDLDSDRKLVSIMTGESDAEAVAAASGAGSLRLVQVAR